MALLLAWLLFSSQALLAEDLPHLSPRQRASECLAYYDTLGQEIRVYQAEMGTGLRLPALASGSKVEDIKEFRSMSYNVLNLQTSDAKSLQLLKDGKIGDAADFAAKPEWARKWIAREILKEEPHVAFLQEVHGFHSLRDFVKDDLKGNYRPILIRGNDHRGIDIGILVHKDLPLDVEVLSTADRTYFNKLFQARLPVYHRDSPVVLLRPKGASPDSPPLAALIGVHAKSQRPFKMIGPDGKEVVDFGGRNLRSNEMRHLLITRQILEERWPGLPIEIKGDFNNDLDSAKEFTNLKGELVDSFSRAQSPLPPGERHTHYFFDKERLNSQPAIVRKRLENGKLEPPVAELGGLKYKGIEGSGPDITSSLLTDKAAWDATMPQPAYKFAPDHSRIDGSFVNEGKNGVPLFVRDARILQHFDEAGNLMPAPKDWDERNLLPSDHRGTMTILDFPALLDWWKKRAQSAPARLPATQ